MLCDRPCADWLSIHLSIALFRLFSSQVADSYRKLRNTARYLVGNLHDFDPAKDSVPYDELPRLDKYILGRLSQMMQEVEEAYDTYQFNRANQALQVSNWIHVEP